MKLPALIASSLLLALGTASISDADAAAKPICKSVTDPAGDVGLYGGTPVTPDPALDLVSADFGANAKGVTAAIRLSSLSKPAATAPGAAVYELRFTHKKSDLVYTLWVSMTGTNPTFGVGTVDTSASAEMAESTGKATGTIDTAKNEIRIFAPYSALGGAKLGIKASIDTVVVKRGAPTQYYGRYADDAAGGKSQFLGAPTCVKLGG